MAERQITLPSGAVVVIRGMKIQEANKLAQRAEPTTAGGSGAQVSAAQAQSHVFNDLLRMCTVSIVDPGPCYEPCGVNVFWDRALVADRFHALIQIRCTTYPDMLYTFRYQCEPRDAGGCGKPFHYGLELEKRGEEIKYKDVPEKSRSMFRAGNRFEALIAGKKVWFSLMTGDDETRAQKWVERNPTSPIGAALAARILEIDGVEDVAKLEWINDLDMVDFIALRDAMEDADGGIDTSLDLLCPHCGHVNFDVTLPFGRQFLMPATSRR